MKSLAQQYTIHMNEVSPHVNAILKGHLFIEDLLNEILNMISVNSNPISKAKLTFSQLTHIVHAFLDDSVHPNLFPSIINLNKLRNVIAHNLAPDDLQGYINKFTSSAVNGIESYGIEVEKPTTLEFCIGLILGQLNATIEELKP